MLLDFELGAVGFELGAVGFELGAVGFELGARVSSKKIKSFRCYSLP